MSIVCRHDNDSCSTCEFKLEEAQEEIKRLQGGVRTLKRLRQVFQDERDEAQEKLWAIHEQVIYGFPGETIANMTVPLTGAEMNRWWQKTISTILECK